MNTFDEVMNAVRSRQRWVVTSHARPDGDAVGSVLGCVQILRAMGKQADGYLSDGVPFIYRGLPGAAEVRMGPVDGAEYDGVIILECDSVHRTQLGGIGGLFSVSIDHHETYAEYADVNYVLSTAAAAAQLVHRLTQAAGVTITPDIATCLYTAVLTDTGSFCYSSTNEQTFAFAREMVLAGADPATVAQQVYFSNTASKMRLLGKALSNLQCEDSISWMHVSEADMESTGASEQDCEGLVNWALGIHGVEATVFFRETANSQYRVSLRSKGRIDVCRIAESFGGGGHFCASGHAIAGPFEIARGRVLAALRAALDVSKKQQNS
ncbi:MAG TPA: bifunctional oligoribonuclease/PAP phosphatase NrnA [Candidatus Saccharimonadales bacterium]|nr:bifunctional oligoribonuclease/PAP phosphatase NrnA [Candidatus Saccharimonadales bacterium]